ncbi:MAG: cell division protein ZipA [Gammaproteobacteria bacterium]|jgi:cell division protein ZipA
MDSLRWIILLVGLGVVAGIYAVSQLQARRKAPGRHGGLQSLDAGDRELNAEGAGEDFEEELQELGRMIEDEVTVSRKQPAPRSGSDKPEPAAVNKVFTLYVLAPAGVPFRGAMLQDALVAAGLEYGDMQIYHHLETVGDRQQILFSVANIREPGTFDPAGMKDFTTDGVVLFFQVPGPVDAVRAFDAMVAAARKLADSLDATVRDATHSFLTNQTISHMREEVIDCQLQQRVAKTAS